MYGEKRNGSWAVKKKKEWLERGGGAVEGDEGRRERTVFRIIFVSTEISSAPSVPVTTIRRYILSYVYIKYLRQSSNEILIRV